MDTTILRKAGLTESQAKGYIALIENGALSPAEIAGYSDETRTNGYAIADKLVELGLATKTNSTKQTFQATNPSALKQLLINRQRELKAVDIELAAIIPSLTATYRLTTDRPGVLYFEGVQSLQQVYTDVIKTGETLRIFPSAHDRDNPEVASMIDMQIERQRNAGIKTEVLINDKSIDDFQKLNDELFEARRGSFQDLDAQVLIYGDNVALSTFNEGIVTTILNSPAIAQSFTRLFQAEWDRHVDASPSDT